ncbi:hypothetical protein Aperf_G00000131761 [Anoplocephala perfoliata]
MPFNYHCPPIPIQTHPGMRDISPQKNPTDNVPVDSKNGPSNSWNTASPNVGPNSWNTDASTSSVRVGGTVSPVSSSGDGGGGSISSRQVCVARFNYKAIQADELTIKPGDRLHVLEKSSDGWWHGVLITPAGGTTDTSGQQQYQQTIGWFPSNYVTMEAAPNRSTITGVHLEKAKTGVSSNQISPPLPSATSLRRPNEISISQAAYIAPTPPPPPPMPAATMGAKTSAPLPVASNLATSSAAASHVSLPPQEPISTVTAAMPPTSFASYSAVPFSTPTSSTSTAFVPSMNPQLQQPQQQQYHQVPSNAVTAPAFIDSSACSTNMPNERFQPYRETVLTLFSFTRNQVEELSFNADEVLEVLDKPADDPEWWRCRNSRGNVGLVPRNYVRPIENTAPVPHHAPPVSANISQPIASTSTAAVALSSHAEEVRRNYVMASPNASEFGHKPWYWGSISRSECEILLTGLGTPGEFFVRDSETHPGDLTITMNAGSKNRNFKVHMKDGEFHIGMKVFTSLDALIDNYRRHPIFKNEQEKHFLTQPFHHPECGAFLTAANVQANSLMQSR